MVHVIGTVTSNTYLAQEGSNKFKEGVNYTTEPIAMITGTTLRTSQRKYTNNTSKC